MTEHTHHSHSHQEPQHPDAKAILAVFKEMAKEHGETPEPVTEMVSRLFGIDGQALVDVAKLVADQHLIALLNDSQGFPGGAAITPDGMKVAFAACMLDAFVCGIEFERRRTK